MPYSARLSLVELSAAVDTLAHEILLARFSATFGCSGTVLSWLRSYLTERTQSVLVNGSLGLEVWSTTGISLRPSAVYHVYISTQ